jgi:hypothetical protein
VDVHGLPGVSTEFNPSVFEFGDAAGAGAWLVGHFRQHLRYNDVLTNQSPPVILPTFAILQVEGGKIGRGAWLNDHASWHNLLRPRANITGIDLSQVNMDDESQFYSWLDAHNQEHQLLDIIFGVA